MRVPLCLALIHGFVSHQTADVELCVKSVPIPDSNVIVELYLFDCAGQSIFNQLDFGTSHVRALERLELGAGWLV